MKIIREFLRFSLNPNRDLSRKGTVWNSISILMVLFVFDFCLFFVYASITFLLRKYHIIEMPHFKAGLYSGSNWRMFVKNCSSSSSFWRGIVPSKFEKQQLETSNWNKCIYVNVLLSIFRRKSFRSFFLIFCLSFVHFYFVLFCVEKIWFGNSKRCRKQHTMDFLLQCCFIWTYSFDQLWFKQCERACLSLLCCPANFRRFFFRIHKNEIRLLVRLYVSWNI